MDLETYYQVNKEDIANYRVIYEKDIERSVKYANEVSTKVRIGPSIIPNAGYGLFALRDFKRGEILTYYGGVLMSRNMYEFLESPKEEIALSEYMLTIKDEWNIDGKLFFRISELGRWANSVPWTKETNPNSIIQNNAVFQIKSIENDEKEPFRAYIAASTKIRKGEEIFVQYGCEYSWNTIFSKEELLKYCPEKK